MIESENKPVEMLIYCPECSSRHIDDPGEYPKGYEGEFETKSHHTHACQYCGHVWRPAIGPTVGVRFLPGFKSTRRGVIPENTRRGVEVEAPSKAEIIDALGRAGFIDSLPDDWNTMGTKPEKGLPVLLCGSSGMLAPHGIFVTSGFYDIKWRPLDPWRDSSGEPLSVRGYKPLYWKYIDFEKYPKGVA